MNLLPLMAWILATCMAAQHEEAVVTANFQRAEAMESIAARSEGSTRWRWLGEAARLYAKDYQGEDSSESAAEAALRHGRVLSRLGRHGEARGAFLRATEIAQDAGRLAHARLELAHAVRRSEERLCAMDLYLELILDPRTPTDLLGDAWEWRGKLQYEYGFLNSAEVSFRAWRACAQNIAEEIRACDRLACLVLERGRLDQAKALLAELESQCAPALNPSTEAGRELFRRLDSMSVRLRMRELAWRSGADGDHDRHRELIGMAHREAHFLDAGLGSKFLGSAMEQQTGRACAVRNDFEISESDAAGPAGPQHLHAGFLGGHAGSQMHTGSLAACALGLFCLSEHPIAQRWAAALEACFETVDLHQIYPDTGNAFWQGNRHLGGA